MADPCQEITVTDKALEPEIPVGAVVVCSTELQPEEGNFIVYIPSGGLPIFRKWRQAPGDMIVLEALNKSSTTYQCSRQELYARGRVFVILSMHREFRFLPGTSQGVGEPAEFLTFPEAMAILKVKRTRMYELLQSGELQASKLGRLWRIDRRSIDRWLASKTFQKK